MPQPEVKFEMMMCCGHKRCPHVSVYSDGSIVVTDDEPISGIMQTIRFNPQQTRELLGILKSQVGG